MMLMRAGGLGIIPDWQFSLDPSVNPKINPNVQWPQGVYQTTVQPFTPYYQGPEGQLQGLARRMRYDRARKRWVAISGLLGLGLIGLALR